MWCIKTGTSALSLVKDEQNCILLVMDNYALSIKDEDSIDPCCVTNRGLSLFLLNTTAKFGGGGGILSAINIQCQSWSADKFKTWFLTIKVYSLGLNLNKKIEFKQTKK